MKELVPAKKEFNVSTFFGSVQSSRNSCICNLWNLLIEKDKSEESWSDPAVSFLKTEQGPEHLS